jgi:hypothetical protein
MKLVNRVMALLLSLAVIAAAVILIIEVIADRAGAAPVVVNWHRVYHWAGNTTWGAAPIRTAMVLLVLLGLGLVLAQLKPRRPDRLALSGDNEATDAAITRQGLVHSVRQAVTEIDGVRTARVVVRRRRITVKVTTRADQAAATVDRDAVAQSAQDAVAQSAVEQSTVAQSAQDAVTRSAQDAVNQLRLRRPPSVSVLVANKES